MSDFQFNADVLRGQMAEVLIDADEEHTMWVISEFAQRTGVMGAESMAAHFDTYNHDRSDVAEFFRELAYHIEAGGKPE